MQSTSIASDLQLIEHVEDACEFGGGGKIELAVEPHECGVVRREVDDEPETLDERLTGSGQEG